MSFSTLKALNLVEKKLANGEGWAQCSFAVDKEGRDVTVTSEAATQFCLLGAVTALDCGQRFKNAAVSKFTAAILELTKNEVSDLVEYNDDHATSFDDVKKVITVAKRLARSDRSKRSVRARNAARKAAAVVTKTDTF